MNAYPSLTDLNNRGEGHLVTIGPNASGKSRRLMIPNLMRLRDWSMVVVDIKGELCRNTAAFRAAQPGHKVVVIDPFGVMPKNYPDLYRDCSFLQSNGFNPVARLDPKSESFADDAMALAEALIRVDSKQEPHWSESAQDLVAAILMYIRLRKPQTCSLADLRRILGKRATDFAITAVAMKAIGNRRGLEALAIKAGRYCDYTPESRELSSIISNALTQTRWIDSPPVKADLAKGGFDFGSLKKTPTTVYLILPPRYLGTHSTWLRVLITSCLMPLLNSVDDADVPTLFMLDEFAQLGKMQVIENNVALMRGYGIKLWLVLQDLSQIKTLYEQRWESFIGNSGVIQCFAPQDKTTREYLASLFGERIYWIQTGGASNSESSGPQGNVTQGINKGAQHIMGPAFWPQDLSAMKVGCSVLYTRGHPFRTWFPDPEDKGDPLKISRALELSRNGHGEVWQAKHG
jgi:type IV secretion system protein VirD4